MKVLVISHTYTAKINRDKFYFLNKKSDISLITPEFWKDDIIAKVPCEQDKILNHFRLKTIFNGHEMIYFYPRNPTLKIPEIKPDIIHVEQGANAVSYFQAILMKKLFWPKAKTIFFTWMNLDYNNPFPINFIEKFNLKNTDYIICGNRDAENIMRERGYTGPITVMPQIGVDPEAFKKKNVKKLRKELGIKDEFLLGFFGRFVEEKGLVTLVNALKDVKGNWECLLIGRGPFKEEVEKEIKKHNLMDRFIFLESVAHEKVIDYMNCLDAYVLPSETTSLWREQFGHVIIESMGCEVPIIGSNSGEIPYVIGDAGLVFKEGDSEDLREKIQLLISNKKERKKYAKLGRKRVLENYTHEILAERIYKIHEKLLES